MNKKGFFGANKKITDDEIIILYKKGLNDSKIAKINDMSPSTIAQRRYRLGLITKENRGGKGKKLDKKGMKISLMKHRVIVINGMIKRLNKEKTILKQLLKGEGK